MCSMRGLHRKKKIQTGRRCRNSPCFMMGKSFIVADAYFFALSFFAIALREQ
jgi:hypothetical protein